MTQPPRAKPGGAEPAAGWIEAPTTPTPLAMQAVCALRPYLLRAPSKSHGAPLAKARLPTSSIDRPPRWRNDGIEATLHPQARSPSEPLRQHAASRACRQSQRPPWPPTTTTAPVPLKPGAQEVAVCEALRSIKEVSFRSTAACHLALVRHDRGEEHGEDGHSKAEATQMSFAH